MRIKNSHSLFSISANKLKILTKKYHNVICQDFLPHVQQLTPRDRQPEPKRPSRYMGTISRKIDKRDRFDTNELSQNLWWLPDRFWIFYLKNQERAMCPRRETAGKSHKTLRALRRAFCF